MKALLLALVLIVPNDDEAGRASEPDFRGQGNGRLTVLKLPENVPLDFYVVQCTRSAPGGGTFSVKRSGNDATPQTADVGEVYLEADRRVSFRIDAGSNDFAEGDTFSFVTFSGEKTLDRLFDRWLNQYVKWIISREERDRFLQLESPIDRIGFIDSFWKRRDPDPITPKNESREEHARRFAYTIRHFGAGIPGWATDRGKIYILLGPPNAIERNPTGRTAFERPSEIWTYNNIANPKLPASFDIGFVDFTATGRYEIVSAKNIDFLAPWRTNIGYAMSELELYGLLRSGETVRDQTTGLGRYVDPTRLTSDLLEFQREIREVEVTPVINLPKLAEVTVARADFPTLPLAVQALSFREGGGQAFVPVTVSMPYARLTPQATEDGYRFSVDVLLRIRDEAGEPHSEPVEDRVELSVDASELKPYRESELLYEASFVLPPGRYQIETLLRDNPSGAIGQTMTALEVPPMDSPGLALSALLLASGAIEVSRAPAGSPRAPFHFGNLRLVPNVNARYSIGDTVTAYAQVYGFARSAGEDAGFLRVEFFILREGRLYSKVKPSYHRPLAREDTAIKSEISLRGFPAGIYTLRIRVTDELTEQTAERDTPFTIGMGPRS